MRELTLDELDSVSGGDRKFGETVGEIAGYVGGFFFGGGVGAGLAGPPALRAVLPWAPTLAAK